MKATAFVDTMIATMDRGSILVVLILSVVLGITTQVDAGPKDRALTVIIDIRTPDPPSSNDSEFDLDTYFHYGLEDVILHGALHIGPSRSGEPPLRTQIVLQSSDTDHHLVDARVYNPSLPPSSSTPGLVPKFGNLRKLLDLGTTTLTNAELMDPSNNGFGLLRTLWTDPFGQFRGVYVEGKSDCMYWLDGLLDPDRGALARSPGTRIRNYAAFQAMLVEYRTSLHQQGAGASVWRNVGLRYREVTDGDPENDRMVVFPIDSDNLDRIIPGVVEIKKEASLIDLWDSPRLQGRGGGAVGLRVLYERPGQPSYAGPKSVGGGETVEDLALRGGARACRLWNVEELRLPTRSEDCDGEQGVAMPEIDRYMFLRHDGTTHQIALVGQSDLTVSDGKTLDDVGPSFVTLDIVNGTWIGDVVGVAGLQSPTDSNESVEEGPIGWITSKPATSYIHPLPDSDRRNETTLPTKGNIAEAIQYAIFGNASQSGNELCQRSNSNCTVLYGANLIAAAFKWPVFDAVALFSAANHGYQSGILDLAKYIKTSQDAGAIATVSCNGTSGSLNQTGRCNDPIFHFNRDAYIVPGTNQSASQIFGRIEKDCAIINPFDQEVIIPSSNITLIGLPTSIVCNNFTNKTTKFDARPPFEIPEFPGPNASTGTTTLRVPQSDFSMNITQSLEQTPPL